MSKLTVQTRVNGNLLVTVLLWAGNFSAVKVLYRELDTAGVALMRTLVTGIFFVALVWMQGKSLRFSDSKTAAKTVLQGFLSMGLYMVLFLAGLKLTSDSAAAIIMAASPLATGLLSVAVGQDKFRWTVLLGALIAVVGILVIFGFGHGKPGELEGNLLIFTGAVIWAVGVIVIRPLLRDHSPEVLSAQGMLGALLVMVPFGWNSVATTNWLALSMNTYLALLYTTLLSGGVAFITYYRGIAQIGAPRATLYQYLVPGAAILIGHFTLGTPILVTQLIGLVIVLAGVALGNRVGSSNQAEAASKLAP